MKLVPLIVRFAVAGNVLIEVGLMLQLLAPNVAGQLKLTVPLKPSCEAIEIGPVMPVLPTFTLGNAPGSPRMKSGFIVTVMVNDVENAGAPSVVASRVTL